MRLTRVAGLAALLLCVGPLASPAPSLADAGPAVSARSCVATDQPDPAFKDSNCDGMDGQVSVARFVSPAGSDGNSCTRTRPCRTLQRGVSVAKAKGLRDVYVAGGSYAGFRMASGISVYGGFGRNFQRDPAKAMGSRTVVVTGVAYAGGRMVTVLADNVTAKATLADLTLRGAATKSPGASSYVIAAHASTLVLTRLVITAGAGSAGLSGGAGADASTLSVPDPGVTGGDAAEYSAECDALSRGAGGGGAAGSGSASPSSRSMDGGTGGAGGTMDTYCDPSPFGTDNLLATDGLVGDAAGFDPEGLPGDGGAGGLQNVCQAGHPGLDGITVNGAPGAAPASGAGRILSGYWAALAGTAGGTGENGSGGGGGGGSAGCDDGIDAYGAGGGGGGSGGVAARGGGAPGAGGGASIAVFLVSTKATLSRLTIKRGVAGAGGSGGSGGHGQPGGSGGPGGLGVGTGAGGAGGDGAHGGHGGGGAGGAGGAAIGVLILGGTVQVASTVTYSGGAPGLGGPGGVSAPGATGTPDDDGPDGPGGPTGLLASLLHCASSTHC